MFKLKIIIIDGWFDQCIAGLLYPFRERVECIIPPTDCLRDLNKLIEFIKSSDAHVVFLEFLEEALRDVNYRPELLDACKGKFVYHTTPTKIADDPPNLPEFPRIGHMGLSVLSPMFLRDDETAKALFFSFIHSLRHHIKWLRHGN